MRTINNRTVLDEIITAKRRRIALAKADVPLKTLRVRAEASAACRDFRTALKLGGGLSLIAEIKKASPTKGILKEDVDPAKLAELYETAGAAAISVITEEDYFLGSPAYLCRAKEAVSLPVLRKDFIFDEYQIYESKVLGADAVLLITAILGDGDLARLIEIVQACGMCPLVEVHDRDELSSAIGCGGGVIGVNNRNLATMQVDIRNTACFLGNIPEGITVVAESGIRSRADMKYIESLGVDAVLVGESIVTANDHVLKIRELLGEA
ncbi:MAG: indole-3-glycerol phosphate synthase TrpC [Planctomycetota bacterium]|jgi:indole-3-glycerol phosphate synthase